MPCTLAILFKIFLFAKKSSECSTPIILPVDLLIPKLIDSYLFSFLLSNISLSIFFLFLFKYSDVPSVEREHTTTNYLFLYVCE